MRLKHLVCLAAIMAASLVITSCGSGTSENVVMFKTVKLSVASATPRFESDLITGNTCETGGPTGTVKTDDVDVTFTAIQYPNFTGLPSPVDIDPNVEIRYEAKTKNTSSVTVPTILTDYVTFSSDPVTGTLTVPVPILTRERKLSLIDQGMFPCDGQVYEYYVTIIFTAVEEGTGDRKQIPCKLTLSVADSV